MMWYSTDEIKETADCRTVMTDMLGYKLNRQSRCAAEWRGGKNPNVEVQEKWFKDYKSGDKGSVIDMVMTVKGVELMQAVEMIGDFLGLQKDPKTRLPDETNPQKKVAEWIYKDARGNPVHKTVRFDKLDAQGNPIKDEYGKNKKTFRQYHWKDNKWVNGLNNIELLPYNLEMIEKHPTIFLCEGEKAAEAGISMGLPCTTFAMGAGSWKEYYGHYFKGKNVIIITDNDDAGREHGQGIAFKLKNIAEGIKIIQVSNKNKGDLADFKDDGGTKEDLFKIIQEAKKVDLTEKPPPQDEAIDKALAKAKQLNKKPLRNYAYKKEIQTDGSEKTVKVPISINELTKMVYDRLLGYPRAIGKELFDFDRDTNKTTVITDVADLFAWLAQKTGHTPYWSNGQGFVTKQELFYALLRSAVSYDTFSNSPEYPISDNTYYMYGEIPPPTPDHVYFKGFCAFFEPASPVDALLIQTMFASLVYFEDGAKRPMWVIDTATGDAQATGKTTLAEMSALLVGGTQTGYGEPLWVRPKEVNTEQSLVTVTKRMLSGDGRRKKVFLIDNIDGYFKSGSLASFATQASFSGIAPYGRGETSRANNMTFILTCNGASLSKDIISRSMFIKLKKPHTYKKDWEIQVKNYIKNHRLQILADIIDIMQKGVSFDVDCSTRFKEWERAVLAPICGSKESHDYVIKEIKKRKTESDGEEVQADLIRESFFEALNSYGLNPTIDYVWIPTKALQAWGIEALPSFKYKPTIITHILKEHNRTGALPELTCDIEKYPTSLSRGIPRTRGMMWCPDGVPMPKGHSARVIVKDADGFTVH
jgi:hypothetical protein